MIRNAPLPPALADAIARYDNDDGMARRYAAEALADRRPAYWTMAGYNDQVGCNFCDALNLMHSFDAAVETLAKLHGLPRLLDRLVPLNELAALELAGAYERHIGSWVEVDELLARGGNRRAAA